MCCWLVLQTRQQGQVGDIYERNAQSISIWFSTAEQDVPSYDGSQLINGKIGANSYHQGTSFQKHSAQMKFITGPKVRVCHREEINISLVSSHIEKN